MHALPQRKAHWSRRRRRRLVAALWIINVAQIVLVGVHPAGWQRVGPVLLAISVLTLLVLAAVAHQITQRPTSTPGLTFTATALGGPCDGASWQLYPNQLPVPRHVWLPAHGKSHLYRLASHRTSEAANPKVSLTYAHRLANMPDTRPK